MEVRRIRMLGLMAAAFVAVTSHPLAAQITQPVWQPPMSLYGRPVSSPYYDFPTWSRYSNCRPAPLTWGFEACPDYGTGDGSEHGYPTVNCPGDFVAHRPSGWYGSAEFAPTTIDFQNTQDIAALGTSGPIVLSTSDLRPGFDAGGRFTIGRRILGCYRLEGTYWGFFQWRDYAAVQDSSGAGGSGTLSTLLSGGFGNAAVAGLDNNSFVSIQQRTKMNSGELNLLYWIDMPPGPFDVSLLVGGRYLELKDQFNLVAINALQENRLQASTLNPLWGIQVGLAGDWLVAPRMWVNFTIKGGIATNEASLTTTYARTDTSSSTTTTTILTADQNRTTFFGDLSLTANFQVTPWLAAKIGYQALFLDGLAVAPDQIPTNENLLITGPAQIDARSNAAIHGPVIGLMTNW